MYSALRQGYIYILSRIDRLAALKGAAEPRKRRLKAQWFYMSNLLLLRPLHMPMRCCFMYLANI